MLEFLKNTIPVKVVKWVATHPAEMFLYAAIAVIVVMVL